MSQGDSLPLQIPGHWVRDRGPDTPEDSHTIASVSLPVFRAQSQPASLN
jgi:hypothetical protein